VAHFRYLGTSVTNHKFIHGEIKNRLNSGNARYHSVQKLLSFRLLSKILVVKIIIYKTIILSVVVYGCETWSLPLKEEHRLRMFENRVLRRIFGPKRDEITRGWRKLHTVELHNMYPSPNVIIIMKSRRIRWAGHVIRMVDKRNAYRIFVGKPEGNRKIGRLRRR
jgi:hypothetical protein